METGPPTDLTQVRDFDDGHEPVRREGAPMNELADGLARERLGGVGVIDRYQLCLATRGGVQDLSRVVNVLALLDLTVVAFIARRRGRGLAIEAQLAGEPKNIALCVGRLRALIAVTEADVAPVLDVEPGSWITGSP
jgi:hypothetical protein